MSSRVRWCCALSVIGILIPVSSFAQTAAPPPEAAPAPEAAPPAPPPEVAPPPSFAPPPPPAPSAPSFKVEAANGSSIKIGLLAQPQFESLGSRTENSTANNLFLRRTRVLIGGSLLKSFDYFFDTDFPNLGKGVDGTATNAMTMVTTGTNAKNTTGLNIQDIMLTYKPLAYDKGLVDMVKLDVGYMLPPLAHNALQSAATLLGWDYFAYSFQHSNAFGATGPVGRDAGVQLRGLLFGGHAEYRVGMFQGRRNVPIVPMGAAEPTDVGGRNFFRVAGRVQVNLLDPETGFFYGGTYLGAKRILSLGASFDVQGTYKYFAFDGIVDMPLGPGVVSAQVNFAQWNWSNDLTLIDLAKQRAIMAEGGYIIGDINLAPVVRFEQLTFADPSAAARSNETRYGGGLALFAFGHNSNLKAFFMKVHPTFMGLHDYNQAVVQWQLFFY
jgi:hypothetical protein